MYKTPPDKWSIRYECCLICGTTDKIHKKHEARGLCCHCYRKLENEKLSLGKPANYWQDKGMYNTVSSPTAKLYQEARDVRLERFKSFIINWFSEETFKEEQSGILLHHEYEERRIEIIVPLSDKEILQYPNHLEEFKDCLEKYLKDSGY